MPRKLDCPVQKILLFRERKPKFNTQSDSLRPKVFIYTYTARTVSSNTSDNETFIILQGRVVRNPINANLGLKVNQNINFSCIKMFFNAYVCAV